MTTVPPVFEEAVNLQSPISVDLDWYANVDEVVVTPRDQQRFKLQAEFAIKILQQFNDGLTQFKARLDLLNSRLVGWQQSHREDIAAAYLTLQDNQFRFVVVRKNAKYDGDFEDALSDIDLQIASDPQLRDFPLDVLSLPPTSPEALSGFLNPQFLLKYAQQSQPQKSRGQEPCTD